MKNLATVSFNFYINTYRISMSCIFHHDFWHIFFFTFHFILQVKSSIFHQLSNAIKIIRTRVQVKNFWAKLQLVPSILRQSLIPRFDEWEEETDGHHVFVLNCLKPRRRLHIQTTKQYQVVPLNPKRQITYRDRISFHFYLICRIPLVFLTIL